MNPRRCIPCRLFLLLFVSLAMLGPTEGAAEERYTVEIVGVDDDELRDALNEASNLVSMTETPPPSVVALRKRADEDGRRLARVLASRAYLAGSVAIDMEPGETPVPVTITVDPGPRYTVSKLDVTFAGDGEPPLDPAALDLPIRPGAPALSADIFAASDKIETELRGKGYALAEVTDRKAEVDHEEHSVALELVANAGPEARFGAVTVDGLETFDDGIVRDRLAWKEGEVFDPAKISETRTALMDTRLFAGLKIDPADEVGPDGELPVTITAEEADTRTVGFGLRYSTSQGPGGKVFWEHRNILGDAETFRAEMRGSFVERAFESSFTRPLFLRPDQDLIVNFEAIDEEPDAFERRSIGGSAIVARQIDEVHTAKLGVGGEFSQVEDFEGERTFTLVSLPGSLERDTTNDLLDPIEGHRIQLSLTPFMPVAGNGAFFVKSRLTGSTYWDFSDDGSTVLAARASVGAIGGADIVDIPADKRFYAGGGGSVRGYAYRHAGDLDVTDDPVGGRSVVEFGLELRQKVTEEIGVVPFIEAGRAYGSSLPELSGDLFVGAGLGVRYYTGIGPLRLDIGVPLKKRDSDAAFQIYISLGQAF